MDKLIYRERIFIDSVDKEYAKTTLRGQKGATIPVEYINITLTAGIYVFYEIRERDDKTRYFDIKPDDNF